jgi:hypothetical protein
MSCDYHVLSILRYAFKINVIFYENTLDLNEMKTYKILQFKVKFYVPGTSPSFCSIIIMLYLLIIKERLSL